MVEALTNVAGAHNVLLSADDRDDYAFDSYSPERTRWAISGGSALPAVVVLPDSTEQVRTVLGIASREHISVVPFGGGTGVMGGAVSLKPGIVLDLRRMDRTVEVSEGGLMVRVQAGKILGSLNTELEDRGFMLGHDPWSRGIATVGGAISTNGVGYLAAKCGSMGEQVLALTVVLASGEVIRAKSVSKLTGPGLASLFVGAEGTLGVITEATLRIFPQPERRTVRVYSFSDFKSGYRALLDMGRRGIRPSMIDFGEEPLEAVPNTFLRVAFEGLEEEVRVQERAAIRVFEAHGGSDLGDAEAGDFWETRHATAEAWAERNAAGRRLARTRGWGRGNRWFDYIHVALPPEGVLDYKRRAEALISAAGMLCREYGIWGRPDLFSMGISGPGDGGTSGAEGRDGDTARGIELSERLVFLAQDMGGTMEYCHGVGLKLLPWVQRELGDGLQALRAIKRALDPHNILNPGKLGL